MFTALSLAALSISRPLALAPLEHLANHCWATTLSAETIDRHCFRILYQGAHISDEHVVTHKGEAVYSGQTIYSAEGSAITFTYFNSLGGVGRGFVTPRTDGLHFYLRMRATPSAASAASKVHWRFTPAGYDVVSRDGIRRFRLDDR